MEKRPDVLEQPMCKQTKMYHFAPVLVLIMLAPTSAEVLPGNLLFTPNFG